MKTCRQKRWLKLVLAAIVAVFALALVTESQAQDVIYHPDSQIVYPTPVQYYRVYQGSSWYWSPALGWHLHTHYINVPYVAVYPVYRQPIHVVGQVVQVIR
jgi:hypothetical protein